MRKIILLFCLCLPPLSVANADSSSINEQDISFREALYYANQGDYLDAIARLEIASGRSYVGEKNNPDPLHIQIGNSIYTVGDFETSYRMKRRAENAIRAILESNADQLLRNEAAFRLARLYMQEGELVNAQKSMDKIAGKVPEHMRDDEVFLRAQIYMAGGDYAGAARTLQKIRDAKSYKGFSAYNLGVALIKAGLEKQGIDQIEIAGKVSGDDEVTSAIRDKANLTLGFWLIDAKQPELAKKYLERVRLTGPFSNKALLGAGWAEIASGRFDSALVPWSALSKRNMTDQTVQESMLGVPYAYAQLNLHGKAVRLYGKALDGFDGEMKRLDASIRSIREGRFFQVLIQSELRREVNWAAKIKALPETPESYYLLDLMAYDDFQEALRNYLDLDDLSEKLESWEKKLDTFASLRQPVNKNLQGYDQQIRQLRSSVQDARSEADSLIAKHRHLIETMAMKELDQRRGKLLEYQTHARIALAESYERASKTPVQSSGAK